MGNPAHLEELLKGVEHWNAWHKKQGDAFRPDFSGTDFRKVYNDANLLRDNRWVPLVGADLGRADLRNADLSDADLRSAFLRFADLRGAYLSEANLVRADLFGANLQGLHILESNFTDADLRKANLRGIHGRLEYTDFERADMRSADLRGLVLGYGNYADADLRGAKLDGTDVLGADRETRAILGGAIVTTLIVWNSTSSTGKWDGELLRTDLSGVIRMTQEQLDSMLGDSETIIPDYLERPSHWPKFEPRVNEPSALVEDADRAPFDRPEKAAETNRNPDNSRTSASAGSKISVFRVRSEAPAISFAMASLIEQLDAEYERLRGKNFLADSDPETYNRSLAFFETLKTSLVQLGESIEMVQSASPDDEDIHAEVAQGWFDKAREGFQEGCQEHFDGKRLGKASVPLSIIFGFGAVGAILTGGNPLGFGAGMLAGKLLNGEVKAGAASDQAQDLFRTDDDMS